MNDDIAKKFNEQVQDQRVTRTKALLWSLYRDATYHSIIEDEELEVRTENGWECVIDVVIRILEEIDPEGVDLELGRTTKDEDTK